MLGGHSTSDPPLPISNRTVKRSRADDSAGSRVKVGHRQALPFNPLQSTLAGVLAFMGTDYLIDDLHLLVGYV